MTLLNTLIPSLNRTPAARQENRPADLSYTFKPVYEITENEGAYDVTVELPGVAKDGLEVTAEEGQVRIVGRRAWKQPEAWTVLHRETVEAPFELVLAHDNVVDVEKIVAELRDGLLRLTLPKHEALKPRKIAVG